MVILITALSQHACTFESLKTQNLFDMKTWILRILVLMSVVLHSSVNAQPVNCQASFIATPDSSGYNFHFTNTSAGNYTNSQWTFGDGTSSTQNSPTHSFNTTGQVYCCLTIWDSLGSCQSTSCDTINLGTTGGIGCSASFGYQHSGNTFYFYGNVFGSGSAIVYNWDFGDGTTGTGHYPVHTYSQPGTYNVCLVATNTATGCIATYCHAVTVAPPPSCSAIFSFSNLSGAVNAMTFISQYASNTATYSWDFGDGHVGTGHSIAHSYQTAGYYNVCLTVSDPTNNCSATFCDSVTIVNNTTCQAAFIYNVNPGLLNAVSFTDVSSGNITNWSWSFGDGNTSTQQNPVHNYTQAGTYQVCLHISNANTGCSSNICHSVTVSTTASQCNAFFSYQSNGGNTFYFVNNNSGYSHSWSFGDGTYSFASNPHHTYGAAGTYQVCHTVYDSLQTCSDTYCSTVTISSGGACNASFTFTVDSSGHVYTFTNTSTGVLGTMVWSFGDGTASYSSNPTHQYTSSGAYIVCLSSTNPATGTITCSYCHTIIVGNSATCAPVFYSYPDSNAVGNGNVNFGIYSPCSNTQFVWDFGDNTNGSGPHPSHQYADSGWYYVCVTAFTPSGNYTECDSVYAFRLGTAITENAASVKLVVYPNPMTGTGNARFMLSASAQVKAILFDTQGRRQSILVDERLNSGEQLININTDGLQSGIYILQLTINDVVIHQRISVVY